MSYREGLSRGGIPMLDEWTSKCDNGDNLRCLMILGNGFDLYHGLKTGYRDFEGWRLASYPHLHNEFNRFEYLQRHGDAELWGELEESLGVDWDTLCYDVLLMTYPNMADDNPGWDDFWTVSVWLKANEFRWQDAR